MKNSQRTLHEFEVANLASSVHLIRSFVAHEISHLPLSAEAQFDLLAAVGEAADNAVLYGQSATGTPNIVRTRVVWDEHSVDVEVIDNGPGFRPNVTKLKLPELTSERGRGVSMMKMLVDELSYPPADIGTVCALSKTFDCVHESEPDAGVLPSRVSGYHSSAPPNVYRNLIENAIEGIWVVDTDGMTTFVNRRMGQMLGYSVQEMLGRSVFDFMDEEGRADARQTRARRAAGMTEQAQQVFRRKDGRKLHALVATSPVYDERGRYCGALDLVADITDRVKAASERQAALLDLADANEELTSLNEELTALNEELQASNDEAGTLNEELRTTNEELLDRSRELEGIATVAQTSAEATSLEELLDSLLPKLVDLLHADAGAILLLEGDELVAHASVGIATKDGDPFKIRYGEGFAGQIAKTRKPAYIRDARTSKLLTTPHLKHLGIRSMLGTPLVQGGRAIGVVHVDWTSVHRQDGSEERLLTIVAERAASAVVAAKLRDETEHQRAELAVLARRLAGEREQLDAVITAMPDPLMVWGKNGKIAYSNPALSRFCDCDLEGMSRSELIRTLRLRYPAGRLFKVAELPCSHAMSGSPASTQEIWLETPAGDKKVVMASATPLEEADYGAVAVWRDVTEERRLGAERDYLASYPETNPNPVVEIAEGLIGYINPAGRRLFSKVKAGDAPPAELVQVLSALPKRRIPGHPLEGDVCIGPRWYRFTVFPVAPRVVRLYGLDVTHRKAAEQELTRLLEAERMAQAALRRKAVVQEGVGRILKAALSAKTDEDLGKACLSVAEEVTASKFGFIGELGLDGMLHDVAVSDLGWELCAMYDKSGHRRPAGDFRIHGLYGRVLDDGRSFFTNSPAKHADSIGTPKDHPPLTAFLGVPLISNDRTTGMIAVANREGGYTEAEQEALEALAPVVVEAFERRRAEAEILLAKDEWERTFASVPDLIALLDNDHKVLRVNEAMAQRLGCDPEGCVGLHCYEAVHGASMPPAFCPHSRTIADGCQHIEEVHEDRLGGDFIVSTTPLLDENGEMTGTVHVAHDITQRKRMEQALRASEERLNRSQEISHLGSWELDLADGTLSWSDEVYRIFGLEPQILGATYEAFLEAIHPDDRAAVDDAYSSSVRDGRDGYEIEHRVVRRHTGEIRIVHEKCQHIRDESGEIIKSVGMVHDITERKQVEDALRTSEQRLRTVIDSLPIGISLLDADAAALEINRANERVWGARMPRPASLEEYRVYKGYHRDSGKLIEPDEWPAPRTAKTKEPSEETVDFERFDGSRGVARVESIPIPGDDNKLDRIVVVTEDITERVEREELSDALNAVADAIHGTLELDEIMNRAVTEAGAAMGCSTATISMRTSEDTWILQYGYGFAENVAGSEMNSRQERHAVLAIETGDIVAVEDARTDRRVNKAHLRSWGVRSVVSLPISTRRQPVGVMSFNYNKPHSFSEAEMDFCRKLRSSLSLAVENSNLFAAEHRIAQTLQEGMLSSPERIPGVEFAHVYHSATEAGLVGGDFYDVFAVDDNQVVLLAGDVSGKGVKAAGLTESVRSAVRALSYGDGTPSPAAVLGRVNDSLARQLAPEEFVTAAMLVVNPHTGRVTGASAGHPLPVVCGRGKSHSLDLPVGPPLGAVSGATYRETRHNLPPRETIVLYTDGLTEARLGSDFYGGERLHALLSRMRTNDPEAIAARLLADAADFARGKLDDDLVILAVKIVHGKSRP